MTTSPSSDPIRSWSIDSPNNGQRLDRFLAAACPDFSRVRIQDFIRDGHVTVNRAPAKPSWPLKAGDQVTIEIPGESQPVPLEAEEMPLRILFEDDVLLVIDKPAGLVVHPGAGNREGTLVNGLLHHCGGISVVGGEDRPGIVHRLDKETSGCLVVAKTEFAHRDLSTKFAGREVDKTYLAVTDGIPRMPHGTIEAAIGRHPTHRQKMAVVERGRDALTRYRVLGKNASRALVECQPKTGRTHQIRVHLKHLGTPVAGDPQYGRRGHEIRHLLHAWRLSFVHPLHGRHMTFEAPLAADFPDWARLTADHLAGPPMASRRT